MIHSIVNNFLSNLQCSIQMSMKWTIQHTELWRFTVRSLLLVVYLTGTLAYWVECSPMSRGDGVQSQVESHQRLKKWYLIYPCLTLSIIRYVSRVKWSNPRKGVAPFPTLRCSSYLKREPSNRPRQRSPTLLYLTWFDIRSFRLKHCTRSKYTTIKTTNRMCTSSKLNRISMPTFFENTIYSKIITKAKVDWIILFLFFLVFLGGFFFALDYSHVISFYLQ